MSDLLSASLQYQSPDGIGSVGDSVSGINTPVAASTGSPVGSGQRMLSGSNKNTPPGSPIFNWDKWEFMWNAYWGTGGFYNGTVLRKMQTEEDDQYMMRRAMCYYRNFFQHIVDACYKPVFAEGAVRKTEIKGTVDEDGTLAPLWHDFMDDVDNKRNTIGNFAKRAVKYARIMEVCFVVMDNMPGIPAEMDVVTAKTFRQYPFIYIRHPMQVEEKQTKLNDFGKIQQICFKENPVIVTSETGEKKEEKRWKLWTENYSVLMRRNERTNELEEIPGTQINYNFGEPPVIPVMQSEVEDNTVLPHPSFYNVAKCNWALLNMDSAQTRAIFAQMFPILQLPMPRGPDSAAIQSINAMQGIYAPPTENGVTPAQAMYIEYPTKDFEAIAAFEQVLIDDMFRQAGQLGIVSTAKQSQSGLSKSYDFHAMTFVLKETARMARKLEDEIARFFQKYVASEVFDYHAQYEEDFQPDEDPLDDVALYTEYMAMDPGPKGKALALKMVTMAVFDDAEETDIQEVLQEIEDNAVEAAKNIEEIPPEAVLPGTLPELQEPTPEMIMKKMTAPINMSPQKKITKLAKKGFSLR